MPNGYSLFIQKYKDERTRETGEDDEMKEHHLG